MNNYEEIRKETLSAITELCSEVDLTKGSIVVIGCSTSEVAGGKIGKNSSEELGVLIFKTIYDYLSAKDIFLAAQCCEHLNRAIIIERCAVPNSETVCVIPQPKAGGSFATAAYKYFSNPVALEEIRADAGIDIGLTLIGMHLKKVVVPLRLKTDRIGSAKITAAYTRPKFIGGERAVYR